MKLTNASEVSVYTISGASTARPLPDWLARRRKRSLKNDTEFAHRVELLQDFEFEEASTAIRISEDGNWVMSTGTYKPQIHVHNLPQLSLSFARHTSSLNTTFQLLSQDYSKSLHLQTDRKLEFHTPMGCHYEMRLPRYGRDLAYDRYSTEALVPAVGLDAEGNGEVFRLNLELGRFMKSYYIDVGQDDDPEAGRQGSIKVGAVNVAAIAEGTHNLLAFGTSKGSVEFWDPRSKSRVAALAGLEGEITALDFAPSGISIATGHSTGLIQIFDLRRPAPILTKDQGYGNPIKNIIHMTTPSQEPKILSADKKVIKIWDENTGNAWTSIEAIVDLNDVAWCPNTGMILTANEGKHQHAFFVPQLGPAPKWCTFLDNMVEEMAEEHNTETYDNYKFLTVAELHEFSLDHLIGKTNLLRPYMHGFFVDNKLYEQARLIHNPYLYEEDRARKVQERAEKKREGRIRGSSKKLKVPQNQNLIDRLAEKDSERGASQKKRQDAEGLLSDSRFGVAFKDSKFVFDENSEEFLAQNNAAAAKAAKHAALKPKSKEVEMRDLPNPAESGSEDLVESESDEEILYGRRKDRSDDEEVEMHISSSKSRGAREKRDSSFATKAKQSGRTGKTKKSEVLGEQEMRFVPEPRTKGNEGANDTKSGVKKRRFEDRRSASGNALRRQ